MAEGTGFEPVRGSLPNRIFPDLSPIVIGDTNRNPVRGGGGEIRTHDTVSGIPLFESGAFNHSATPPF